MHDTIRHIDRKGGISAGATLLQGGRRAGAPPAGRHHRLPGRLVARRRPDDAALCRHRRNQFKELADKCKADLGFTMQYTSLISDDVVKRAVTQPSSFDLLDSEYWMLKKIVPSGNLRGMDAKKIKYYDEIVPIFTKGELPDGKKVATQGIAPIKVAYLTAEKSEKFATRRPQWMTVIPTVYNADTLGIRPDLIKRPIDSWARAAQPRIQGQGRRS